MDIINLNQNPALTGETDADRLGRLIFREKLSLDLVSAFAGDRKLTGDETAFIAEFHAERGPQFYCDLLYSITHRHFPPEAAEDLWNKILQHKYEMSSLMKRNIHRKWMP